MSDSDDDYDDTVDDRVFPHPWERVFDEYKGAVMSMEDEIAMQELAFMNPTRKMYTHDSSRNSVLCFDCLSVLGVDEVYCRNCTQASSCECSHGCT